MQEAGNLSKEMNPGIETDFYKSESSFWQRAAFWGASLILAFLLGFVPSWLSERETVRQRDAAQQNLRLSLMQNRLAMAAITARRGEYEPARLAVSNFFTDLRAEFERREGAFNADQREAIRRILGERDELITLLARNDRAAIERLADLYLSYAGAVNPAARKQTAEIPSKSSESRTGK